MNHSGQIAMNGAAEIEIDAVAGNLRIRGADVETINWQADGDERGRLENALNESGESIHLGGFSGNLRLEVPASVRLRIGSIGGNMRVKSVAGELTVDTVGGDLSLRKGGEFVVGTVGGNLQAKQITGPVSIGKAGGDISLLDIFGDVRSAMAGGNVALNNVQGGIRATAGGDAKLHVTPIAQNEYKIKAGHNIHCYMPPTASARVQARSDKLELHWPDVDGPMLNQENQVDFQLGDGEASLTLEAGHLIEIYCQTGRNSEDVHSRDEGNNERNINFDFDFDLDLDGLGGLLSERVQRKVQRAMEQAETHIANAMRQVEHNIAQAEHRVAHMNAKWDAQAHSSGSSRTGKRKRYKVKSNRRNTHPYAPTPPHPPSAVGVSAQGAGRVVGDEERMMILKMVEDGKIDVEQAEKLLVALGELN